MAYRNEARSHVKCAVRLTDNDGTHTGDNPLLSLNRGLANWRVNLGRWNRPSDVCGPMPVMSVGGSRCLPHSLMTTHAIQYISVFHE